MIAVAMGPALFRARLTAALLLTPHEPESAKNLSPQFTSVCVSLTTVLIAGVISAHFDIAPQHMLAQLAFIASWFIDPDASSTIRMSGGSFAEGWSIEAHTARPPPPPVP